MSALLRSHRNGFNDTKFPLKSHAVVLEGYSVIQIITFIFSVYVERYEYAWA